MAYSLLFVLSALFIVPHYLSSTFNDFLVMLLTDTEPEGESIVRSFSSLLWIFIPLTSIGLTIMSWIASPPENIYESKLPNSAGKLFLVASLVPAFLVVRKLITYHVLDLALSAAADPIGTLSLFLKSALRTNLFLGQGVWVVPVIVFVETGLFFGFFLPGDSLLFTVGLLASVGSADLTFLTPIMIMAAILGDQLGYMIGSRSGGVLARRYLFVRNRIRYANQFFSRHGGKAVVFARFIPVLRTFAPVLAGMGAMRYVRFTFFNMTGAVLWVVSVTLAGYSIGSRIPAVVRYVSPMCLIVILASSLVWTAVSICVHAKGKR
jgi:membrane-associated protein